MESAGLTNIPPVDEILALHLALKPSSVSNKPTFFSRHCRFSVAQLEKIYSAQGLTGLCKVKRGLMLCSQCSVFAVTNKELFLRK